MSTKGQKPELDTTRERTERLKALRLEHEARVRQLLRSAGNTNGRAGSRSHAGPAKRAGKPEKKITLADWLAQQRALGRET